MRLLEVDPEGGQDPTWTVEPEEKEREMAGNVGSWLTNLTESFGMQRVATKLIQRHLVV